MSVSEERMLILTMLQEGKITSEEAAKLLEALEGGTKQGTAENTTKQNRQQADFSEELGKMKERLKEWKKDFKKEYNEKEFDKIIDDLSSKAEKVGKNVAATTFGIVDRVIDYVGSFVDTNSFNIFGSYTAEDRSFEAAATDSMNLDIEAVNGNILVKKHLDDRVIIRSRVRSPINNADSILLFSKMEDGLSLKINKLGNISVSHEVFLPALWFGAVKLETSNGKIYVEDSKSDSLEAITRNSNIELMGVNAETVKVDTKNAKVQVSYVVGRKIDITTSNTVIDVKHVKTQEINAITTNGRVLVENVQSYEESSDVNMNLRTTNGGIKVNMNDMESRGYKVRGRTTNGSINVLIPEMIYHNVNRHGMGGSFVEAESSGFEGYPQKVTVSAETNNGFIEIVK